MQMNVYIQVFQPMLMQYFTYEELKDIKKQVIAQHSSQQRWNCAAEVLHKAFKYADHEKTDDGESDRPLHYLS
jgi:F-box/leucine-rich repeat protein 5